MLIKKLYIGENEEMTPRLFDYQPTDIAEYTMEDDNYVLFIGNASEIKATFRQMSRRGFYNPCGTVPRKLNNDRVYGLCISDGYVTLWGEDSVLDLLADSWKYNF